MVWLVNDIELSKMNQAQTMSQVQEHIQLIFHRLRTKNQPGESELPEEKQSKVWEKHRISHLQMPTTLTGVKQGLLIQNGVLEQAKDNH